MNLNYNFLELCSVSLDPGAVVILSYLHFNFQQTVANSLKDLKRKLNIKYKPNLDYKQCIYSRNHKIKSKFKIKKPMVYLKFTNVLTMPVKVQLKFIYLYYVSCLHPYSTDKFIPKELLVSNVDLLIMSGLADEAPGGIILTNER